jgi:hypothetical protein
MGIGSFQPFQQRLLGYRAFRIAERGGQFNLDSPESLLIQRAGQNLLVFRRLALGKVLNGS